MQTFKEVEEYFNGKETIQKKVFDLLKDKEWHCRVCEGAQVASSQYAGGGGIQGLERGTKSRAGLVVNTETKRCETCKRDTKHDKLTGDTKSSNAPSGIPKSLQNKILEELNHTDVVEYRKRQAHELVIDHKVPMERWGSTEEKNDSKMSSEEIRKKFQLLKKDEGGNHNLLKSRNCELCIKTGKRGYPLGIKYWYEGNENWPEDIDPVGANAEKGCIGCGWYDFAVWRESLNSKIE